MARVSVVGNSGSGKSTLAGALAGRLGVPYVELDAIFHLADWADLPEEEFRRRVTAVAATPAWVIDGNYNAVRDLVWERADTVVWVDPPRSVVMGRVIRRTLVRVLTRRELWNGNREPWSNLFSADPQKSIIAWSWTQHAKYRERYEAAAADPELRRMTFVRLRSAREVDAYLASAEVG